MATDNKSPLSPSNNALLHAARFPLEAQITTKIIELRAWQIWQEEGCPVDKDVEFWQRAEQEVIKTSAHSNARMHSAPEIQLTGPMIAKNTQAAATQQEGLQEK